MYKKGKNDFGVALKTEISLSEFERNEMLDNEPGLCNPSNLKSKPLSSTINSTLVGNKWRNKNLSTVNLFEIKKANIKEDVTLHNLQSTMGNWLKSDNKKPKVKKNKKQIYEDNLLEQLPLHDNISPHVKQDNKSNDVDNIFVDRTNR